MPLSGNLGEIVKTRLASNLFEVSRVPRPHDEGRWYPAVTGSTDGIWDSDIVRHTVFLSALWKESRGYRHRV
jgi:hypothetical protein